MLYWVAADVSQEEEVDFCWLPNKLHPGLLGDQPGAPSKVGFGATDGAAAKSGGQTRRN
jgi:hypothetical protein